MYPELMKYKQIKKQYEDQLNKLKLEQKDLEEEKETMLEEYEKLLSQITSHQKANSPERVSLTGLKSEIQQLTEELGDVMEESSHLSRSQKERLHEWMKPLREGMDREVMAAKQHLRLKKEEFQRYRMELLLLLQQVYEMEDYIQDIHYSYTEACNEYLSEQDKKTLQLQAINVRREAKHMLSELQQDLDYVMKNGKTPEWFQEKVKATTGGEL
ncbi:hypothetical protein [Pseudalkalibacillus sp. SCS-8]|uniref:hypothetical protein n=1 Tax=Pseudalkalibacillus nanhaiensis TaxID=3115291 RepID=UPI0032D9DE66